MLLVILDLTCDDLEWLSQGHVVFNSSILETVHVRHMATVDHIYIIFLYERIYN